MKRVFLIVLASTLLLFADKRTQPPTVNTVAPTGVVRGKTAKIEIEGSRLEGASQIIFSDVNVTGHVTGVKEIPQEEERRSGVNSSIELGDRPPKNQVTVEVVASEQATPGVVRFRLVTPLGTTNTGVLAVSPFAEMTLPAQRSPQPISLPAAILGTIARPGDANGFTFDVKPQEQFVFQVVAGAVGSPLDPEITLRQGVNAITTVHDTVLVLPTPDPGRYQLEIRDYQHRGGANFTFRLNAGAVPYITSAFPLGFKHGDTPDIALFGINLEDHSKWKSTAATVSVPGALNQLRLDVGDYPEVFEREGAQGNDTPKTAQRVTLPVTINGVIAGGMAARGAVDRDYYRFTAHKGQRLTLEVMAQRLGSPLDSVIEVLDARGQPIERATLRPVADTVLTLNDPSSTQGSLRILSWSSIHVNDYLFTGNELLRVAMLPRGPDEDIFLVAPNGRRIGYMDTTPANLAVNTPVYKVEVHPPATQFPANGMPVFHLYYRNDDAQGTAFTRDSLLHFTAPADGEYLVRIEDSRGMEDDRFAYRLTIHEEKPDFTLSVSPANPNVPRGGSVPVQVTATRLDGFDKAITVRMEGLPAGVTVANAVIPPGQDSAVLQVSADVTAEITHPATIHVVGFAGETMHEADAGDRLRLLALAPPPDVRVALEPSAITLQPGGAVHVKVHVERANGFTGRVPVDIRNLPPGVSVPDIGLNGVLVNEQESSREFTLVAADWASPITQSLYAVARVETRSPTSAAYASAPLALTVK